MNEHVQIAIIGAGLSGLYAAYQLEKAGISYVVLEARAQTGGRILSCANEPADAARSADAEGRVDLGATWIWPAFQPLLAALTTELDIALIPQAEEGDMLYERAHHQPPSRHPGYASSPPSMRIAGGMRQLTERLEARIAAEQVVTDARVMRIERTVSEVQVHTVSSDEHGRMFTAQTVLLALPPALAAGIEYLPTLPAGLAGEWAGTGTWMAPHAKYVAIYEHDFWRQAGLSGEARSSVGPMAEIHDASVPGRVHALFGFIGIPARSRWTTSEENLKALCRAQLTRLFGEKASKPVAEYFKDWADDPFTATEKDLLIQAGHSVPAAYADRGPWADCLRGIGSEWSAQFPGYLAGAVEASLEGVRQVQQSIAQKN